MLLLHLRVLDGATPVSVTATGIGEWAKSLGAAPAISKPEYLTMLLQLVIVLVSRLQYLLMLCSKGSYDDCFLHRLV